MRTLIDKVGEQAAHELEKFGIDSAEKLERVEEVLYIQGFGEKELKEVKKILAKADGKKSGKKQPKEPVKEPDKEPDKEPAAESFTPKHVGGGYYELSDGSKVKGKKAAFQAQAKIDGGE